MEWHMVLMRYLEPSLQKIHTGLYQQHSCTTECIYLLTIKIDLIWHGIKTKLCMFNDSAAMCIQSRLTAWSSARPLQKTVHNATYLLIKTTDYHRMLPFLNCKKSGSHKKKTCKLTTMWLLHRVRISKLYKFAMLAGTTVDRNVLPWALFFFLGSTEALQVESPLVSGLSTRLSDTERSMFLHFVVFLRRKKLDIKSGYYFAKQS